MKEKAIIKTHVKLEQIKELIELERIKEIKASYSPIKHYFMLAFSPFMSINFEK